MGGASTWTQSIDEGPVFSHPNFHWYQIRTKTCHQVDIISQTRSKMPILLFWGWALPPSQLNAIGLKIDSPSYKSCSIKAPTTSLFPQIMLRQPWFKLLKNFIKWESCIMPHTANASNYCKTDQFSTRHRKLRLCSRWIIAIPNSFHVE